MGTAMTDRPRTADIPTIEAGDELLSIATVAEEVGKSIPTVRSYYWRGWLRGRETPIGMLFRRKDVEAFKARQARTSK